MTEIENLGGLPWNWMFIILTIFLLFISIKINTFPRHDISRKYGNY